MLDSEISDENQVNTTQSDQSVKLVMYKSSKRITLKRAVQNLTVVLRTIARVNHLIPSRTQK